MFNATQLRDILKWSISEHGDVTERRDDGLEVVFALRLDGLLDVTLRIQWQDLETLAKQLQTHASLHVSPAPRLLAELMADVAIIASHIAPDVTGPSDSTRRLRLFSHRVRTKFAVACAVYLARSRGYNIPIGRIPWDSASYAVQNRDGGQLVHIFEEPLPEAPSIGKPAGAVATSRQSPREYPHLTIRRLDMQFVDAFPVPHPSSRRVSQVLTAESFSNLLSVSEMENWSSTVVLRLLKEVLNPAVLPNFAHHLSTVSGADWRRLHAWIYGPDGSELWVYRNRSNLRLSLLSSVAQ